jgi:hypothetical protein
MATIQAVTGALRAAKLQMQKSETFRETFPHPRGEMVRIMKRWSDGFSVVQAGALVGLDYSGPNRDEMLAAGMAAVAAKGMAVAAPAMQGMSAIVS